MKKAILFTIHLSLVANVVLAQDPVDIFRAIDNNNIEIVKRIIEEDPLKINSRGNNGQTPLVNAILRRNHEIARYLLNQGAVVNCGDNNLRAPVHFANWNSDSLLLDLLLSYGGIVDTRAIGGATPLIHASLNNNFRMARFLVNRGADINIQCNSLTTPLYFTVLNNNMEFLNYLLDKGAEMDIPDFLGRTPLHIAVRDGNLPVAKRLIEMGASISRADNYCGRSLIHIASAEGHSEIVRLLLENGANPDMPDGNGYTSLDLALKYRNVSVANILKAGGATTKMVKSEQQLLREQGPLYEVIKLQNGSWAVSTPRSLLVMGYSETGAASDLNSVYNGHLTGDILGQKKKVYVVDHDFHPYKSSYSLTGTNPLLKLLNQDNSANFILNPAHQALYSVYSLMNDYYPKPSERIDLGEIEVTLLGSYPGNACYVIEMDDLTIVWLTGICDNYIVTRRDTGIIKEIKSRNIKPDMLFLGSPAGIGPEFAHGIRESFIETMELSSIRVFVFGHEMLEQKVRYQLERSGYNTLNLVTSSFPGDRFVVMPANRR